MRSRGVEKRCLLPWCGGHHSQRHRELQDLWFHFCFPEKNKKQNKISPHNLRDKGFILAQFQVTVHYCRVLEQLATPHPQSRAERNERVYTCLSLAYSLYLYTLGSKPREWRHPRWVSLPTSTGGIKAVPQRHTPKPT